ncbi:L-alanine exporter AlaE [Roseibium sp.]|uniref:L-alanine exporter AlaE n=1 Tax=Roseibium sp. TaxID=1936156 RepID=UPI003265719F
MRTSIIDTIATIVFFTVFATFSELVIAGMDLASVLTTRLVMIPVMIATGRPYTFWRDWLFSQVQPRGRLSTVAADIAAFLVFQVPVYGATLMIAGRARRKPSSRSVRPLCSWSCSRGHSACSWNSFVACSASNRLGDTRSSC